MAARLAKALGLPVEVLLNAAGHASPIQQHEAVSALARLVGEPARVSVQLPVVDPDRPDLPPIERVQHLLSRREDAFVTRLSGKEHAPYEGECIVVRGREPVEGSGVILRLSGRLTAWTRTGDHLENGRGETTALPSRSRASSSGLSKRWTSSELARLLSVCRLRACE